MQQGGFHGGLHQFQPMPIATPGQYAGSFEDLASMAMVAAGFHDAEEFTIDERGASTANRWPQHETLELIKIRSEMDAAFRNATFKGFLWEEVSRRLSERGIVRSGKKCKEKFENVHKYYKRTKEGRAGRQDGRSYRFFMQLEALNSRNEPGPDPMSVNKNSRPPRPVPVHSDSSGSESEDGVGEGGRKRKGGMGKTMAFFDELMARVVEQQEAMQRRFLEAVERREEERMRRDEARKAEEMARIALEQEIIEREQAAAAARDLALLEFLRRISGRPRQPNEETHDPAGSSASRWPKTEVLALIRIRSGLESRYRDAGPKAPLWEEISDEMRRSGYSRSAKRCKEKWENINKYYKKVKDSNRNRPENSKTCPYFHQLDALYRHKETDGVDANSGDGTKLPEFALEYGQKQPCEDCEENGDGTDVEDEEEEEEAGRQAERIEHRRFNSDSSTLKDSGGNPFLALVR